MRQSALLFMIMSIGISGIIHVPDEFTTIQEGLDASLPEDTVLVAPGTYPGTVRLPEHEVMLASHFILAEDTCYIPQTVLDGENAGIAVVITQIPEIVRIVTGFTVTNGSSTSGGGFFIHNAGAELSHLDIHHNGQWGDVSFGGGVYIDSDADYPIMMDHLKIRYNEIRVRS